MLTWVTDHYATFGTKVIPTRMREGLFVLDEIFALRDRDTELHIAEHATDTSGSPTCSLAPTTWSGWPSRPAFAISPTSACGPQDHRSRPSAPLIL